MSKAAELASLASASETALSNRNIVINGAMQVSQRATSATALGGATSYPTCDRWNLQGSSAGRLTMTQTADGPSGFANCIKLDCTTADTSVDAGEYLILRQLFEGQNLQRIKKGTSAAEQITVSFYVKASGAFNFILELFDRDNFRGVSKLYATTTDWVRHEITFPADTTGAFGDDNANSMDLAFWLHSGSQYSSGTLQTSWVSNTNANRAAGIGSFYSSTNNEFFITGVQMEVGPVATPFEDRSFGQELALCQRYYEKSYNHDTAVGSSTDVGALYGPGPTGNLTTGFLGSSQTYAVNKRAASTIVIYSTSGNSGKCTRDNFGVGNDANSTVLTAHQTSEKMFLVYSSGSFNAQTIVYHYTADAEL